LPEYDPSSKNPTVVKANSLVQAGYRLTIAEQRLMLSAICQVNSKEDLSDQEVYSVSAEEFAANSGIPIKKAYEELSAAAQRLYRREVRIERGPNGVNNGPRGRVTMTRWVQSVDYIESEGRVTLRFGTDIVPYLSMIQREFTSYELRHVATMRSTYGVRLYELLQQYRDFGEREIEIEDLRRMFGVPEGSYKAIKDLKHRVIEPAVRDVCEKSDLTVTWTQRKAGRRIAAILFRFTPKHQMHQKLRKKKTYTKADLAKDGSLAKPGETLEQALVRLNQEKLPL
jgi:plasmid replication initiation protein